MNVKYFNYLFHLNYVPVNQIIFLFYIPKIKLHDLLTYNISSLLAGIKKITEKHRSFKYEMRKTIFETYAYQFQCNSI